MGISLSRLRRIARGIPFYRKIYAQLWPDAQASLDRSRDRRREGGCGATRSI
jgi:hypothetical protein